MESFVVEEFERLSENANNLRQYIEINLNDLRADLINHAAGYVYLAQYAAAAKGQVTAARNKMEAIRGELFVRHKHSSLGGSRGPSDETVKAMVSKDLSMQEVRREVALAEMDDAFWTSVMTAMNHRGYFLRELFSSDNRANNIERQYPAYMRNTMTDLVDQANQRGEFVQSGGYEDLEAARLANTLDKMSNVMRPHTKGDL